MRTYAKSEIISIARSYEVELDEDWTGPGQLWPIIEEMMMSGCVVVLKLDGARDPDKGDNGKFTIIASGGPLGNEMIRGDFDTLEEGLSYLVGNYHAAASP